jgi:hypothetical protein
MRKDVGVQITREVDVKAVQDGEMVTEQLERDNVQDTLQAVDGLRDQNSLVATAAILIETINEGSVIVAADDDGCSLSGGHLGKGRLYLGVEGVTGHDDDDGHVLINQSKRTVLELSGKDT